MTEFTREFIAEQRKSLIHSVSISKGIIVYVDGKQLVACGEHDHDTNSWNCAPYLTVEIEEDAETVKNCVWYYADALDHIERQQARIEELEIKQHIHWDANMMLTMADNFKGYIDLIIELQTKLKDMEAKLDLHQTNRRLLNRDLGFAHERIEELEQVSQDQALTISQNDYAYTIDKEMMEAEIKASNDLLRSAWMIAKRDGNETNWEAWRKQLDIALARQHEIMYGDSEQALNEVTK